MRLNTRMLVVPLIMSIPPRATVSAQADNVPVSVRWNRLVPRFLDELAASRKAARAAAAAAHDSVALRRLAMTPPTILFQVYTPLSVAQYAAANSAKDRNTSYKAAVASASAAVLTNVFTDSSVRASIERELARDLEQTQAAIAGKTLGEDIARRVIAYAPTLNLVGPWNGTIPKGAGMWYSAPGIPPLGINVGKSRALWLLDSAAQFRPGPPLVFDSPEWKSALDEVRRIARERTPEQTKLAQKWNSVDPWAPWNETASAAILRHHLTETEAARVLAVMNVAATDAIIACFEAKYHYWSIRPSQADTTIVLAETVMLPNFPSYPSGHACSAGAFDASLGAYFADERAQFTRIAEEQAMSRLYGGIHYRFDDDTGLALGRVVARYDVDRERRGVLKQLTSK